MALFWLTEPAHTASHVQCLMQQSNFISCHQFRFLYVMILYCIPMIKKQSPYNWLIWMANGAHNKLGIHIIGFHAQMLDFVQGQASTMESLWDCYSHWEFPNLPEGQITQLWKSTSPVHKSSFCRFRTLNSPKYTKSSPSSRQVSTFFSTPKRQHFW